jgi:uncharacterized membrane protein SirB2
MDAALLYPWLKSLHVGAVAASGVLFLVRGVWMLSESDMLRRRWVRIVPHAVDTVLLVAALGLLWILDLNPLAHDWLAAKLAALAGYIVSGSVALKRGRTQAVRVSALIIAIALFLYMAGTALTRDPVFFLPR